MQFLQKSIWFDWCSMPQSRKNLVLKACFIPPGKLRSYF
jgi:hypothetical protein